MKKTLSNILFAALVVLAAASCQKDLSLESQSEGLRVITCYMETPSDTKGILDGTTPKWEAGDQIWISNGSDAPVTITLAESDITSNKATISTSLTGTLYAVYPASAQNGVTNDGKIGIKVPTSTTCTFAEAHIAVAQGEGSLSFKNAVTILKITTADETKSVNIASTANVSGEFNVTYGENLTMVAGTNPAKRVMLTSSGAGEKYVAIAPDIAFNTVTFTAIKSATNWAAKTSTNTNTTAINTVYNIGDVSGADWSYTGANNGSLWGEFSVSGSKKVRFSKGNLRAKKDDGDNWTWGFYDKQYECNSLNTGCDSDGKRTAQATDTEIDLFTWGYGTNSTNPTTTSYESTFTDWGTVMGGSVWSTLSKDEWKYLLSGGADGRGSGVRYFKFPVSVAGKANCLVIAPDGNTTAIEESYDASAWETAEASGLICLPPAGYRYSSNVSVVGSNGYYWSATHHNGNEAYSPYFANSRVYLSNISNRASCLSVRLVCSVSN